MKKKVLFICTHNSARSQMAEGLLRHMYSDRYEVYSAGVAPTRVHPFAIRAMEGLGIDISGHTSKDLRDFLGDEFDYVITVCGHAHDNCPVFPGAAKVIHVGFDDPPKLASEARTEEEALNCYRRVRDEIKAFVQSLPEALS